MGTFDTQAEADAEAARLTKKAEVEAARMPTPSEYEKFAFGHTPKKGIFKVPWTNGRNYERIVDDWIEGSGVIQEATTIKWSSPDINKVGTKLFEALSKKLNQAYADGWLLANDLRVKEAIWYVVEELPDAGRAGELKRLLAKLHIKVVVKRPTHP